MTDTRPAPAEISAEPERGRSGMRRALTVIQALLCVGVLVVLWAPARQGVNRINAFAHHTGRSGYLTNQQWRCLEQRLRQEVPAGSRVYVNPNLPNVNPKVGTGHEAWSLMAISLPDRVLVAEPEPGAYELSLALVAGTPGQPGDCRDVRLVAEVVR